MTSTALPLPFAQVPLPPRGQVDVSCRFGEAALNLSRYVPALPHNQSTSAEILAASADWPQYHVWEACALVVAARGMVR